MLSLNLGMLPSKFDGWTIGPFLGKLSEGDGRWKRVETPQVEALFSMRPKKIHRSLRNMGLLSNRVPPNSQWIIKWSIYIYIICDFPRCSLLKWLYIRYPLCSDPQHDPRVLPKLCHVATDPTSCRSKAQVAATVLTQWPFEEVRVETLAITESFFFAAWWWLEHWFNMVYIIWDNNG